MVIDQGVVLPPKAIEKAKIKGQGARTTWGLWGNRGFEKKKCYHDLPYLVWCCLLSNLYVVCALMYFFLGWERLYSGQLCSGLWVCICVMVNYYCWCYIMLVYDGELLLVLYNSNLSYFLLVFSLMKYLQKHGEILIFVFEREALKEGLAQHDHTHQEVTVTHFWTESEKEIEPDTFRTCG
jgi:hypothetical protein